MKGRASLQNYFLPAYGCCSGCNRHGMEMAVQLRVWSFSITFFHTKINWISDPKIAVYAIAVIGVWSIIGYNMVLFLSGLQEIPRDYYEAASIDGATGVKQFFHITIPLLSPTIFFVMVTPCYRCHAGIRPDLHGYGQKQSCTLQNTVTCLPVLPEFLCTE
mgnify:CR=1 FL=1